MKIFLIFILISSVSSAQKLNRSKNVQLLSSAISDVINELFIRQKLKLEILIYDEVSPHIYDVINGLGRSSFFTNISSSSYTREKSNRRELIMESTLIFCKSLEKIKKFIDNHELDIREFPKHNTVLFYTEEQINVSQLEVRDLSSSFGEIEWYSYFMFKHKSKFINSKNSFLINF